MKTLYSPSRLPLRAACPGSARMEAESPAMETPEMAEGHRLHAVIAEALGKGIIPEDQADKALVEVAKAVEQSLSGMVKPKVLIEHAVSLEWIHPGLGTGRIDYAAVDGEVGAVVDWKTGWGEDGDYDLQLAAYAAGLCEQYDLDRVVAAVVYLRRGKTCIHTYSADEILSMVERIRSIVAACEAPDAELRPGAHCRFCAAVASCPKMRDMALSIDVSLAPDRLPPTMMAKLLDATQALETFIGAIKERAYAMLTAGKSIPGWELAEGRKTRHWRDTPDLIQQLEAAVKAAGGDPSAIWERTLRSPAQVEKVVGKKAVASLIESRPGKPRLARAVSGRKVEAQELPAPAPEDIPF